MRIFSRTRDLRNRVSLYRVPFDRPAIKHFSNCPLVTENYSRETESQKKKKKYRQAPESSLLGHPSLRDAKRGFEEIHSGKNSTLKETEVSFLAALSRFTYSSWILLRQKIPRKMRRSRSDFSFDLFTFSNLEEMRLRAKIVRKSVIKIEKFSIIWNTIHSVIELL